MSSAALSGESRGGSPPRDLTTWDDASLLAAYRANGDAEAFAQIAARHGAMVYRTCFHQLGNAHDSEDAAQAVFLMLAERANQVKTSLVGWLYLAARNTALTSLRARRARQKREEAAALRKQAPAAPVVPTEELDEGIARLPERLREPLILCYLEGHRQEVAARMLGCNQSTLSRRATEAIEQLRSFLVRRGAVVTTAVVLGYLGQQKALAVPVALAGKLAVVAAGKTAAAGEVTSLADAVVKAAFWAKAKVCAAVVGAVTTVTVVSALVVIPAAVPVVPTVERATLRGHTGSIITLAFSPKGDVLATGSEDRNIKLWDPATAKELAGWEATPDAKGVRLIAFAPDGRTLASADAQGFVKTWDLATRQMLCSWQADSADLSGLAYQADGKTIITGGGSAGLIKRWDAATGQFQTTLVTDPAGLRCVRISPDGKSTLATSNGHQVRLYDLATGAPTAVFAPSDSEANQGKIHLLAFFPDGRRLASVNYSGAATVRDLGSDKPKVKFQTQKQWVEGLTVSPDGLTLATAGGEKLSEVSHEATTLLSDAMTGAVRATLRGHADSINCLAFSPDGKTLATGSSDRTCKLWMPAKPGEGASKK